MNVDQKELAIGIDLGTTYSCVAVFRDGKCEIIPDINSGKRTFPSYVAFTENGRLIGHQAKEQAELNAKNTIYDVKRLIGNHYQEVEADIKQWPFEVEEANQKIQISVNYRGKDETFSPETISAMVLRQMKSIAEKYLERTITKAVITVPAYFNNAQRQATKDAGTIAGLTVLRIINEPTAAALAYGLSNGQFNYERNVLVFDLGGGTLDVSILTIVNGIFEVKATSGDSHLGGEDFDNLLVKYVLEMYKEKFEAGVDPTQNSERSNAESDAEDSDSESDKESIASDDEGIEANETILSILKAKCEQAKRDLSDPSTHEAKIEINAENVSFSLTITRDKFEELCADLFATVLIPVEAALEYARMNAHDIADIVLVGGSTRIPKIEENLIKYFGADKTLNKSINPDEAVAFGAAVQAAIIMGNEEETLKNYILLDVVPRSLGIEGADRKMDVFIPRNTLIPAIETKFFQPKISRQATVKVSVFEGEHPLVRENNLLGTFRLNLSQMSLTTKPLIELTFNIDANGILKVTAIDTTGGNQSEITIDNDSFRLSKEEITEMTEVLNENDQFDREQRERLKAKESLQTTLYQVETLLKEIEGNSLLPLTEETNLKQMFNQTTEWLTNHPNATKEECQNKQNTLDSMTGPISHIWFEKAQQLG